MPIPLLETEKGFQGPEMDWMVIKRGRPHLSTLSILIKTVTALLLLFQVTSHELAAQRFPTRIFTELDGLPSSDVKDVLQTHDGRLWFATRTGLISYDGMSWSPIGPRKGLPFASLLAIETDSRNRLWVLSATETAVVSVAERGRWAVAFPAENQQLPEDFEPVDFSVAGDSKPRILMLSKSGDVGIWNGAWQTVEGLPRDSPILAIGSENNSFWLAGEKLWQLDESGNLETQPLPADATGPLLAQTQIGERRWLVGSTWAGWIHIESAGSLPKLQGFRRLSESLAATPGDTHLSSDGQGGLIIASGSGIFRVTSDSVQRLGPPQGLGSRTASGAMLDREGQVWITSKQGVTKIRSFLTTAWDRRDGLFDDEVSAIAELPDGTIVLGHEGGLSRLKIGSSPGDHVVTESFSSSEVGRHFRVMDIAVIDQQTLWIAASDGALARRQENPRPQWTWPLRASRENQVAGLAVHPQSGTLWAAGRTGVGPVVDLEIRWDSSSPENVRRIIFDQDANLYAATHLHGMWKMDSNGRWIRLTEPAGEGQELSLFTVFAGKDTVWVGGSKGLYRIRGNQLQKVDSVGVHRPVFALLGDSRNSLWVGTDDGAFRRHDRKTRHFGLAHGLLGRETNRAALIEDRHGAVWIGTQLGVTRIASADQQNLPPPRVEIGHLNVGARALPSDRPTTLSHDNNGVTYTLRRLTLIDADRIEWAARLMGLETDFQSLESSVSEVRYVNLPPGDYELEVKARWKGQDWGPTTRSAPLHVDRPWWLDPRAQTATMLCAGALIWLLAWAFSAQRHSRLLERQVEERTHELQSLTLQLRSEIDEHRRTETNLRVANVAAEQASRAKSSFLATMSHEIRTPMNGVLGIARLLARDKTLNPQQRERVDTLHKSGQALLEILDDILDYSKIEAGRLDIELHRFDLHLLLDDVVALFSSRAHEKELDLVLDRNPNLPRWTLGDSSRIRQILSNLVGNAVKFTDKGSVTLQAFHRSSKRNVVLKVVDTGIGIEEELQWQLFQPFHQLESSNRRRHGGTGLGLAISHHLVSAMDGHLRVESRLGEGTSFSLELPLPETEAPVRPEVDPSVKAHPKTRASLTILVAEDNPINQTIIIDMLAELGFEDVSIASNGLEVLSAVDEKSFDLILMDLQMPELDGLETSRHLTEKLGADTPRLVALTAHAIAGTDELCKEAGMDDYLSKPVSFEELARVLF